MIERTNQTLGVLGFDLAIYSVTYYSRGAHPPLSQWCIFLYFSNIYKYIILLFYILASPYFDHDAYMHHA